MRYMIPILMVASMSGVEPDQNRLEGLFFGLSYHTASHSEYNGVNPGFGLGIAHRIARDELYDLKYSKTDLTLVAGSYLDSYEKQAKFFMPGFRINWGEMNYWHSWVGVNLGYFQGSGFHGVGVMPTCGFGWDRYDLALTAATGMVACFVKVDLIRW